MEKAISGSLVRENFERNDRQQICEQWLRIYAST